MIVAIVFLLVTPALFILLNAASEYNERLEKSQVKDKKCGYDSWGRLKPCGKLKKEV